MSSQRKKLKFFGGRFGPTLGEINGEKAPRSERGTPMKEFIEKKEAEGYRVVSEEEGESDSPYLPDQEVREVVLEKPRAGMTAVEAQMEEAREARERDAAILEDLGGKDGEA